MEDNKMKAIINAKILLDDTFIEDKILLFDQQVIHIEDEVDLQNVEVIDAKGAYVSAGFIDLHIHGNGGADVMDATPDALETISSTLLQTGTTSFLATTMTMSEQDIDNALQNIQLHSDEVTGANILGIHLEGPFINASKHGAQDKEYVQKANISLIENYMSEIKMITLAPEIEGSEHFVKLLTKEYPNTILSIGHSDASYEESLESFTWGISHATHLFNAMNPYHHRKPGIVGAVFDADVTCDIIADLVHTHPSTLELVHRVKKEKLILVTDAMRAGCMKCGTYDLGGRRVEVSNGKAVLEDGTLAGSVLKMNDALANMKTYTSMGLVEIINSVTKIPAGKLGINKGELKVGYDADIVIFDEKFSIILTIVNGEVKYRRTSNSFA
ncbi:MAG: N-acetylglucosamine-6-phosphate deacetylase [Epsilonproteobacteria bacterium]|nr:MAG: N-acetylglucosamine-6-phosphate deacetylase [Campylobacterota bacterium]